MARANFVNNPDGLIHWAEDGKAFSPTLAKGITANFPAGGDLGGFLTFKVETATSTAGLPFGYKNAYGDTMFSFWHAPRYDTAPAGTELVLDTSVLPSSMTLTASQLAGVEVYAYNQVNYPNWGYTRISSVTVNGSTVHVPYVPEAFNGIDSTLRFVVLVPEVKDPQVATADNLTVTAEGETAAVSNPAESFVTQATRNLGFNGIKPLTPFYQVAMAPGAKTIPTLVKMTYDPAYAEGLSTSTFAIGVITDSGRYAFNYKLLDAQHDPVAHTITARLPEFPENDGPVVFAVIADTDPVANTLVESAPDQTFTAAYDTVPGSDGYTMFTSTAGSFNTSAGYKTFYKVDATEAERNMLALNNSTAQNFTQYTSTFTLSEGEHTLTYGWYAEDANYHGYLNTEYVKVDATPPVTEGVAVVGASVTLAGILYTNPRSTVTFSAADPVSNNVASGVGGFQYFVDVSPEACPPGDEYSDPTAAPGTCNNHYAESPQFQLSGGTRTLNFYALDRVQNAEPLKSQTVVVDDAAPQTTLSANGVVWNVEGTLRMTAEAQLSLSALDPPGTDAVVSGVKNIVRLVDTDPSSCDFSLPSYSTATVGSCENYLYDGEFAVPTGTHTVTYFALDNVDNAGAAQSLQVYRFAPDSVAPRSTLNFAPSFESGGVIYVPSGGLGSISAIDDLEASGDGLGTGISASHLAVDGQAVALPVSGLPAGSHTLSYYSVDTFNNAESSKTASVFVDNGAPETPQLRYADAYTLGSGEILVSPNTPFWFDAVNDPPSEGGASGGKDVLYTVDGSSFTAVTSTFTVALGADAELSLGYYGRDNVLNAGAGQSKNFIFDATPPVAEAYLGTNLSTGTEVFCTDYDILRLSGSDAPVLGRETGPVRLAYQIDGATPIVYSPNRAVPLPAGEHELAYFAIDSAGNISSHTVLAHVSEHQGSADMLPPNTEIWHMNSFDDGAGKVYTVGEFALNATDDLSGLFTVVYKVDPSEELLSLGLSSSTVDQFDWYWDGFVNIPDEGAHTIAYGAADYAGNYEVLKTTTVYVDLTPPVAPFIVSPNMYRISWDDWWAWDWMWNSGMEPVIIRPDSKLYFPFFDPEVNGVASGPKAAYALFGTEQTWPWPQMPIDPSLGNGYQVGGQDRATEVSYYSEDNLGHSSDGRRDAVLVDGTAPASRLILNGEEADISSGTIYVGDYDDLEFLVEDPAIAGLSAQAYALYKLDDLDYAESYGAFSLAPGTYTLTWHGQDLVGNAEADRSITVISQHLIDDIEPPFTNIGSVREYYMDETSVWLNPVPWALGGSDALSGVEATYYKWNPSPEELAAGLTPETTVNFEVFSGMFMPQDEGPAGVLAFGSVDKVGNYEALLTRMVYFDLTPPSVEIGVNGSTGTFNGTVQTRSAISLVWTDAISSGVPAGLNSETLRYVVDRGMSACADSLPEEIDPSQPAGTCANPIYAGSFQLSAGEHAVWVSASDRIGNTAEQVIEFTVTQSAVVSSVVPSTGPIGTPFTLDGMGFGTYNGANTRVKIGVSTAPISVWNDTQIKGRIPGALAPGEYAGVVERLADGALQSSDTFYFAVTAPEVLTVTPSSGPIGVPYTLTGTGFGVYNGSYTRVLIAGATTPISVWNDGKVQGTIPGGLSEGAKECVLEIATADGGLVRSATFQFEVTTPRADSVSVSSGPIGLPFTISGANFGPYNGANTRALVGGTTAPISVWNDSTIQGTIPGLSETGEKTIVVERATTDGGLVRSAEMPFLLTVPVIDSMVPVAGPIGIAYTLGGHSFGPYNGANTQVLIGDTTTAISVWNDTQIKGTIPGLENGEHSVVVMRKTADGGLVQSSSFTFTVLGLELNAISRSSGPIGVPFTITGANFGAYNGSSTRVVVGVSTAAISVWNDTTIQGTIPGVAAGSYDLAIERATSDGGLMRLTTGFLVTTPAIAAMSPASGPIGTAYTLTGTSFGPYNGTNTQVLIGGTTTPISVWNDSTIKGTVPGLENGSYAVIVRRKVSDGTVVESSSATYTVSGIELASITPSSGPIGIPFTINGTSFGVYNGSNTRVKVGTVSAPISVWNDTQIKGTIPGVAAGNYELAIERVTTDGGLMRATTSFVVAGPVVSSLSTSSGPIGLPITLNGYNFGTYNGSNTRVKINGVVMPVSVWNDTKIQGTVPGIAQPGEYPLVVERATTDGGLMQSAVSTFTVVLPQLSLLSPSTLLVGTVAYTLNGSGFGTYNGANTVVLMGGTTTTVSVWTDTQIKGTTPGTLASGVHQVVVKRLAQGVVAESNALTLSLTLPVISELSPSAGVAGTGFTITGTGFGSYDGTVVGGYPSTRVKVGTMVASLSEWTDTQIRGIIPDTLGSGSYAVTVQRVTSIGSATSNAATFIIGGGGSQAAAGARSAAAYGLANFTPARGRAAVTDYPTKLVEAGLMLPKAYGGRPESWNRTAIKVPEDALASDTFITIALNKGEESSLADLEAAMVPSKVAAVGPSTVFGPLTAKVNAALLIELPYSATAIPDGKSELDLAIHKWNKAAGLWESIPTELDTRNKRLRATVTTFGTYQAMATRMLFADATFKLGEVYAFPNPAKGGNKPTLHIEVGVADFVKVRIYDVAGDLRHSVQLDSAPSIIDDGSGPAYAYEYAWNAGGVGSGVYIFVIEAHKGDETIRATRKLTYIR